MLLKDNRKRALRGFIECELIDSKKLYIITGSILISYLIINMVIGIITLKTSSQSNNNGGSLTTGFGTIVICMLVAAIVMATSKDKFKSSFIFPLDRLTYIVGNFIIFAINIIGLLLLSSLVFIMETISFNILASIYSNFIYINSVSLGSFLIGFWLSFCYILAFTALVYLVFLLFSRFKLPGVIVFILVAGIPIFFGIGRTVYYKIIVFFLKEQSVFSLSVKLLLCAVTLHMLSYLVIRNLEVNN